MQLWKSAVTANRLEPSGIVCEKGVDYDGVPTYIIIALSHLSDNPQSPSHMPSGLICAIAFNWHKARFAFPSVAFQ